MEKEYNSVVIEFKGLKINGILHSYYKLAGWDYEDITFFMLPKTFDMYKKFAGYMIERIRHLDPDIYDPLVSSWTINTVKNLDESFDTEMRDDILNILKKNVEFSIKKRTEEIEEILTSERARNKEEV